MVNAHKDFNTAPLDPALEQEVKSIVDDLSLTEKVKMLSGHGFFEKLIAQKRMDLMLGDPSLGSAPILRTRLGRDAM